MELETLGQKRVVLNYGLPTQHQKELAHKIKVKTAELIDLLQAIRNDKVSETYEQSSKALQYNSEKKLRLIAMAQIDFELACMLAVKAVFN